MKPVKSLQVRSRDVLIECCMSLNNVILLYVLHCTCRLTEQFMPAHTRMSTPKLCSKVCVCVCVLVYSPALHHPVCMYVSTDNLPAPTSTMDGDLRKVVEYHVNSEGKVVKVSETVYCMHTYLQHAYLHGTSTGGQL